MNEDLNTSDEILEKIKQESENNLAGWKRAMADYQNLKRETSKEKAELREVVEEKVVLEFLPVLDNLKKAVEGFNKQDKWIEGVNYVVAQFQDLLNKFGIKKVSPMGEKFDPNLAEAVGGDGDYVVEVIQEGYRRDDKIIRPARVIVGHVAEKLN